ncbi:hypothetical protein BJY16_009174 [Actinoplanes octamycinicus]|uniref:Uncharacterized protein n=1 Tax=Actinoplanes octamycinicus TaxID=135948 RepID=A0A7W7H828_9ACTN|nr:hypothetical protein [Actinoplanes octamycinicus]MBB4745715.1 hypothetical protein [Actinoplanes octamycinicus]GIE56561.1 hypothetical protein Aoc01nite_19630 [Actinoplanes octamycinicus]
MAEVDLTTPADVAGEAYATAVRTKSLKLKQELIRQTLEDSASWTRAVNDKWANDHPGEWDGLPIPPEEIQQYRQRVQTEDYEWVVPSFERYLEPDPDKLTPIIDALAKVEAMLQGRADQEGGWTGSSPALQRINDVRADMTLWEGAFKENFVDRFLTPLGNVVPNQREVIALSREQLEGAKIIHIRFRKSVLSMLDNGIKAVQQLSNSACKGSDVLKWGSIALCVVGTIGGGMTLGVGAAAAAVAIDVLGTVAGGLVPSDKEATKLDLAANTATEVAGKILSAQSALDNDTYSQEEIVTTALRSLYSIVSTERQPTRTSNRSTAFGVATPALADATPGQITGGSFRPRH